MEDPNTVYSSHLLELQVEGMQLEAIQSIIDSARENGKLDLLHEFMNDFFFAYIKPKTP